MTRTRPCYLLSSAGRTLLFYKPPSGSICREDVHLDIDLRISLSNLHPSSGQDRLPIAEVTDHSITKSKITKSQITKSQITKSQITKSQITPSPDHSITRSPHHRLPITTSRITTSRITTSRITTSRITTLPHPHHPITPSLTPA